MKGKVLEYSEDSRTGVISGDDGNRYKLNISEWKSGPLCQDSCHSLEV